MSRELLSSKIVALEEEPKVRSVPSAPTSVAGAVGVTERGPIGQAGLCASFEEFETRFGGPTRDSELALAAMGFFENGGGQLWVVRTVHYDDVSDAESVTAVRAEGFLVATMAATPAVLVGTAPGPYALEDGHLIRLTVDGGAPADATFTGEAASVESAAAEPYALEDGMTLRVRMDRGAEQTITLSAGDFDDITNAEAAEVASAINAVLSGGLANANAGAVRIASQTEGTASRIEVTGGTAVAALSLPTDESVGSGNVTDLNTVILAEVQVVVEAAIPGVRVSAGASGGLELRTVSAGSSASIQADVATAASFGLDSDLHQGGDSISADAIRIEGKDPGAYANRVEVEVRAAANGDASAFDLLVVEDGAYRESFPNLSMDPDHAQYLESVVNNPRTGSLYVRCVDLRLAGASVPTPQLAGLAGGDDGLNELDDADFVGSEAAGTGLHAFDRVQELSLLLVPGRATPAVHAAMVRYCEVTRDGMVFAVLDPPAAQSATDIVTYVTSTAALENLSEYAAIYWPRVKVLNPAKSVFGSAEQVVVPPSGIIAGVYARIDASRPGGVYETPAGIEQGRMLGVLGFETDEVLEERKRDLIYPHRINPLTTGPGLPRFIDGSRTLKGDGNFPYVAERRGVIFIERSLKLGLSFVRHKNHTEALRAQVRRTITAFLLTQMKNNAFRSTEPTKAFFVDVSEKLNPPSVVFAGKLIARVGLATNKPAEFGILRISQDTRSLDAELAEANG